MGKNNYELELSQEETTGTIMHQIRCPNDKARLTGVARHRYNILTGPQCEFYLKCPECENTYSIDIEINMALFDIVIKGSVDIHDT